MKETNKKKGRKRAVPEKGAVTERDKKKKLTLGERAYGKRATTKSRPYGKKEATEEHVTSKKTAKKARDKRIAEKDGSEKGAAVKKTTAQRTKVRPANSKRTGQKPKKKAVFAENRHVSDQPVRLNRYIAQAGICARRKADELIKEGRVKVNDAVVTEMGIKISPGDVVEVNGVRITPLTFDYILLHKPTNVITTNQDDRERRIVIDLIEDEKLKNKGLFPVGRLDRNTTGVLLITNDGELAHRLMHPSYEIEKLYVVRTQDNLQPHELDKLMGGMHIGGEEYRMDEVAYTNLPKKNELGVSLHEGKNRHIRKMMEALGHKVTRLERVRYAGLTTKDVRPGKWRRLDDVEIRRLRRLVKLK